MTPTRFDARSSPPARLVRQPWFGGRREPSRFPRRGGRDPSVRPALHRSRVPRFRRHRPRHPGFAVKFYTDEGTFDLVGNNIPVFFIQDGLKFPDVIHAAKPHPDREIPQAKSAHDTFSDFVSLHRGASTSPCGTCPTGGSRRRFAPWRGSGCTRSASSRPTAPRPSSSFTGNQGRRPLADPGGGSACRRRGPRLPSTRPRRRDRGPPVPPMGAGDPNLPGHRGADLRGHRPARPDQAGPRRTGTREPLQGVGASPLVGGRRGDVRESRGTACIHRGLGQGAECPAAGQRQCAGRQPRVSCRAPPPRELVVGAVEVSLRPLAVRVRCVEGDVRGAGLDLLVGQHPRGRRAGGP